MKMTLHLEFDATGKGHVYCPESKSDFPTKNITRDVATLIAEALDIMGAEDEPGCPKSPQPRILRTKEAMEAINKNRRANGYYPAYTPQQITEWAL